MFFTVYVYWDHGGAGPALFFLAIGVSIVLLASRWLTRSAPLLMSLMRSRSVNLVARRGNPRVWLVAHLDSKSQTIPMLLRIASIVLTVIAVVIVAASLVSALLATLAGDLEFAQAELFLIFAFLTVICVGPMIACFTLNASAGAVDNASGVVSVLLAAREVASRPNVGVIITSGEELGLAGARAYVAAHPEVAIALN
ncbi:MAG TPA: M28 family peptidase, partial [Gemmatimonadaceae bacterium]|nr:M28 family peptidase [Gemmatimonadaceae bacterium]